MTLNRVLHDYQVALIDAADSRAGDTRKSQLVLAAERHEAVLAWRRARNIPQAGLPHDEVAFVRQALQ